MLIRRVLAALLSLALLAAACGDDDSDGSPDTGSGNPISTPEYLTFRDQPTACGADAPPPAQAMSFTEPDDLGLSESVTAVVHTSCGEITLELDPSLAPETVNSFVFLAEEGYFDGTVSHRVAPGFVIQAGDPTATGRGGPGYVIPDELPPVGFEYERGTVAMANAGANTGGSQFFVMLADRALPAAYTVFGHVADGFDVMDRIAEVPVVARGGSVEASSPIETVYIERVEIER